MQARSLVIALSLLVGIAQAAGLEIMSPTGPQREVRQVQARFTAAMAPLGRADSAAPFSAECSHPGKGYWADERTWVYDLPAGLRGGDRCRFLPLAGLKTLAGEVVATNPEYRFNIVGPVVERSLPAFGSQHIDEDQAFVLLLNAPAKAESVDPNIRCEVQGIQEAIPVMRVIGKARQQILDSAKAKEHFGDFDDALVEVVRCTRPLPPKAKLHLVWGPGVSTQSGQLHQAEQRIDFQTREHFSARMNCTRENAKAGCNPLLPIRVQLTAPVARALLDAITLKDKSGKPYPQVRGDTAEPFDNGIQFKGPFPSNSELTLNLPEKFLDDAGRALVNAERFPLAVRVGELPPLVKFSGEFGIIERNAGSLLPLTLRSLEPGAEGTAARLRWVRLESDADILAWMQRLHDFEQLRYEARKDNKPRDMRKERFLVAGSPNLQDMTLPKPNGAQAFEVVGVPLPKSGYYVLEAESRRLGQALLCVDQPMYVRATTLVTNLVVHFKWGPKRSLAWVTRLDNGKPVDGAQVAVRDCKGKLFAQARTDAKGMSLIPRGLPDPRGAEYDCPLFVSARLGDDLAFARSNWDEGIETWRFGLPEDWEQDDRRAHTLLDRSLLRPGETVHMKHILRETQLFGLGYAGKLPQTLEIQHSASSQRWYLPLLWSNGAAVNDWKIPSNAKRGDYSIRLLDKKIDPKAALGELEWQPGLDSGQFSVGDFRIPLMKASLSPVDAPVIARDSVAFDAAIGYLNGGAAKNLAIKMRGQIEPRYVRFEDYTEYEFAGRRPTDNGEAETETLDLAAEALTLDGGGAGRGRVTGIPALESPHQLRAELEYTDPNGEIQTISQRLPWWPAGVVLGIKRGEWVKAGQNHALYFLALDTNGKPLTKVPVNATLALNQNLGYRVRLTGGFYGYREERKQIPLDTACAGETDAKGRFACEVKPDASGEIFVAATARDAKGRVATAHHSYWVAGKDETWFAQDNHDRIDLLPEKKSYQPGEKARFQVRMPFREATALVTVERDGILDAKIVTLSGKSPVIEVPVKDTWAPNVFVSALVVRGRVEGIQPTAFVDLGRPAFKLGIAGIDVGKKSLQLNVQVKPERTDYQIREKARVKISVRGADGKPLPPATDVAIAAVDEGLLELAPNDSWKLLDAMQAQRGYAMQTFTAQMYITGKRHFGKKALPGGGGGGRLPTRELFDTLLYWNPTVTLDAKGEATVEVPLNDSLTAFRIVAVAAGQSKFGSGQATIRSRQDLQIISGLAPVVREGDQVQTYFTLRNGTQQPMKVNLESRITGIRTLPKPLSLDLAAGESKELKLPITVPELVDSLGWSLIAQQIGGKASDSIKVSQRVDPAVPVQVQSTSLYRLEPSLALPVAAPESALPKRGEIRATLAATLGDGLTGVRAWMRQYPFGCLEQKTSKAIATRDARAWEEVVEALPGQIDAQGLATFFPGMERGSVALTAYILSISDEAGWALPVDSRARMEKALEEFVAGRIDGASGNGLPDQAATNLRLAALEALSRQGKATPALIGTVKPDVKKLATAALSDWIGILKRSPKLAKRDALLKEALAALRARYTYTGQRLNLADEARDNLWWMMASSDTGAVRSLLGVLDLPEWRDDIAKLTSGLLSRQSRGRWNTTTANAWGVLALERHAELFEKVHPTGTSRADLGKEARLVDWKAFPNGATASFPLPESPDTLKLNHDGAGAPYVTVAVTAAVPPRESKARGYSIKREVIAIEQKQPGKWSRGDIARIRLTVSARDAMGWVVLQDPVPAGASILGTGLKRDSAILSGGEASSGNAWPAWQERRFDSFVSYYEYVPRGDFTTEYTIRLNNAGTFNLPATRVEAMYAPEMYGEAPNADMTVAP
ncbi:MAG: alpha-2-macroglobulin [Hydrogenophilales bacterium]|nr:alpha-2-macroglobulin [Hydrogenophilales bacterium]